MTVFSQKLDELIDTIALAVRSDVSILARALCVGRHDLAVAVGSGGSAAGAEFLAVCRDSLQSAPTLIRTPMALALGSEDLTRARVWLFSARGENPDVVGALRAAVTRRAGAIHIVTTNGDSRLVREASALTNAHVHIVPVADAKDGFLATHSLAATVVVLIRAADLCSESPMRTALEEPVLTAARARLSGDYRARLASEFSSISHSDTLLLLADPRLSPAAVAIETSSWEAAICPVQRTDFRNFAHGRHVWLAHHGKNTFMLSLTGTDTRDAWLDIEAAIPSDLRRVNIDYANCGRYQNLIGILDALVIVEAMGRACAVDPGKPGVGSFASEIYEASSLERLASRLTSAVRQKQVAAIERDDPQACTVDMVAEGAAVHARFEAATFHALVLDYDGTVVSTPGRYDPPRGDIVAELERLLNEGLKVAFATGRGGSAGEQLRCQLSARHHPYVLMGYYNGAYLRPLSVDIREDRPPRHPAIGNVIGWLGSRPDLFRDGAAESIRDSGVQVSIAATSVRDPDTFVALLNSAFSADTRVRLTRSEHSFDICLADACKTKVVGALAQGLGDSDLQVLCIGDSGAKLGNDHVLLGLPYGVSVHHVCDRANVCWSFFGAVITGPDALLRILRALQADGQGRVRLSVQDLRLGV